VCSAQEVLDAMQRASCRLGVLLLDACREPPYALARRSGSAAPAGLAAMQPHSGAAVAFACAPGATSAEGDADDGLFMRHLLRHLATPGLAIDALLRAVSAAVAAETSGAQAPHVAHCLLPGADACLVPAPGDAADDAEEDDGETQQEAAPGEECGDEPLHSPPPPAHADVVAFLARCDLDEEADALCSSLAALGVRKERDLLHVDDEMVAALPLTPVAVKKLRAGLAAAHAAAAQAHAGGIAADAMPGAATGDGDVPSPPLSAAAQAAQDALPQLLMAQHHGDVAAVVRYLRAHASVAAAQVHGCAAVQSIAAAHGDATCAAPGAVEAVVCALRAHAADAATQLAGCGALINLFVGNAAAVKAHAACSGAVEAVTAALCAHAADAALQEEACWALQNMCSDNPPCAAAAAAAGAIEALVVALTAHAASAGVTAKASAALAALAAGDDARAARVAAAGGVDAVLTALRAHALDREVQKRCVTALLATCWRCEAARQRARDAGAAAALNDALLRCGLYSRTRVLIKEALARVVGP
jgi:hypothetical protein